MTTTTTKPGSAGTAIAEVETVDAEKMLSKAEARELTGRLQASLVDTWELIVRAYVGRAWKALGYDTWNIYCAQELNGCRFRPPSAERLVTVTSLRDAGLSLRAIESATGISKKTIIKDLKQVGESTPPDDEHEVIDEDELAEELIASAPPGAPTKSTPGQTDRVAEALAKAKAKTAPEPKPIIGLDGKMYPAKSKPKPTSKPDPQPEAKLDRQPEAELPAVDEDEYDDEDDPPIRFWVNGIQGDAGIIDRYIGDVEDIYTCTMQDGPDASVPLAAADLGDVLTAPPFWREEDPPPYVYDDAKAAAELYDRLTAVLPRLGEPQELLGRRRRPC